MFELRNEEKELNMGELFVVYSYLLNFNSLLMIMMIMIAKVD